MPKDRGKLVCQSLWKIFGPGAETLMNRTGGNPSLIQINEAGLIGAVCNVDIDVKDGEIFIIMGLSGSGKSTLVRCLSRLIEPTGGHIFFDGVDLLRANKQEMIDIRRHKMGMVFQHFALLPHLTVLQNVAFPLEIQGVPAQKRTKRAMEVVELVGLDGREQYFPRELSGGQQQRVGIARSLAVEPELWFLDEPFSALDPLIRREMQDEFVRLQTMLKKTIVFITHDFDEAVRLADRIAIMKDGKIEQIGTPEDLIVNPMTDYVREFTQDVSRAKVLSAQSIMQPTDPEGTQYAAEILPSLKIIDMAPMFDDRDLPLAVIGEDGTRIGQVTRQAVVDIIMTS